MSKLRHAYNYEYPRIKTPSLEPSLTEQSHADSCNINLIMRKYQRTGMIDHVAKYAPEYGLMDGADFQAKQNAVANAITMFEELPSSAREHFDHDPAKFLDFAMSINDETERSELIRAGLLDPDPYDTPTVLAKARRDDPTPSNEPSVDDSPDNPERLPE